jgi:hypothetical protein
MAAINYRALSLACKRVLGNLYNPRVDERKLFIHNRDSLELELNEDTSIKRLTDFYASQISFYMERSGMPIKKSCKKVFVVYHAQDSIRIDAIRGLINIPQDISSTSNGLRFYKVIKSGNDQAILERYEVVIKDNELQKFAERITFELTHDQNRTVAEISKEEMKHPYWFKHIKSKYDFQRNPMNKKIHDILSPASESSYHGIKLWLINSGLIMILVDGIWVNINKQQMHDISDGKVSVGDDVRNEISMHLGMSQMAVISNTTRTVGKGKKTNSKPVI